MIFAIMVAILVVCFWSEHQHENKSSSKPDLILEKRAIVNELNELCKSTNSLTLCRLRDILSADSELSYRLTKELVR